jgi:hypothetical protein
LWSVHGQYRPLATVALDLGLDGRFARVDKTTDAGDTSSSTQGNTGGLLLSAAPGVYFNAVSSFWLFARCQVPFYKNLNGEQDIKPSVALGLQYQAAYIAHPSAGASSESTRRRFSLLSTMMDTCK